MMRKVLLPLFSLAAALVAAHASDAAPVDDGSGSARVVQVSTRSGSPVHQRITLGLGKAVIVEIDADARDVLVSNPDIVDAVVRTPRRVFLMGQKGGQTNAFFFDSAGKQIASIDIRVEKDVTDLAKMLHAAFPDSDIRVQAMNETVVLSGSVASAAQSQRAQEIATSFVGETKNGDAKKVINVLQIKSSEQVMLKVRIAEMQRTIAKQFGVDLTGALSVAGVPISAGTSNPFGLVGHALSDLSGTQVGSVCQAAFYPQRAGNTVTTLTNGNTTNTAITGSNSTTSNLSNSSSTGSNLSNGANSSTGSSSSLGSTSSLNAGAPLSGATSGNVQYVVQMVNGQPVVTGVLSGTLTPGATTGTATLGQTFSGSATATQGASSASTATQALATATSLAQAIANATNTVQNIVNGSNTVTTLSNNSACSSPNNLQGVVKALEQVGLVHILAEPNLTAVSGETAKFLAGGEFPIPVAKDRDGNITVAFKQFGVGLSFTPVVLAPGRISLQLSTEVSELTNTGAYTLQGSTSSNGLVIPALSVRRAETTVEVPSGGSFSIAGLMQKTTKQVIDGFPGAKDMPILGALFRSRDFANDETELVVLVTAYLVKPTVEAKLQAPTDGFVAPTDLETILLGRLNAVYSNDKHPETAKAPGGYIVE